MSAVSLEDYQNQLIDLSSQLASFESMDSGLSVIYGDLLKNGVKRSDAQYLHQMDPDMLPSKAQVNSFTLHPSKTNLKVALEAINVKQAGIIAALIAALGAFIYKVYGWITGDGGNSVAPTAATGENVEKSQEKVLDSIEKIQSKDNFQELQSRIDAAYKQHIKTAEPAEGPNELTDKMMDSNSDFSRAFKHILESTIPKLHTLIESTVNHYNDLAKRPGGNPEMRELDSPDTTAVQIGVTMSTLDASIMRAMDALSKDIDSLKITPPNRDGGEVDARKIVAKAAQLHTELQAMTHRPTQTRELDIAKFKSRVEQNVVGSLFEKLNETTLRLQPFVTKEARNELLATSINWPGDIQNNPELFKKAQRIYDNYRRTIHDLTTALSKLYIAIKFAGDSYVRYMQKMNQILMFSDADYAAKHGL